MSFQKYFKLNIATKNNLIGLKNYQDPNFSYNQHSNFLRKNATKTNKNRGLPLH